MKYRDLIIVGLGVIVLVILLKPKKKKALAPDNLTQPDAAQPGNVNNLKNAEIAINAYADAVDDGATQQTLDSLQQQIIAKYSLRVYRAKDGKFVASTLDGTAVLAAA